MRKILLSLAALATIGIALPAVNTSANAETMIIKKHRDWNRGHHRDHVVVREGWRHRHHHHGAKVVIR